MTDIATPNGIINTTHPSNIMANSKAAKVAIAQAMHNKMVELPEDDYHQLLLNGFRLQGLIRHLNDEGLWSGQIEDYLDNEFDDDVITHLPHKFLGIPKEFNKVASNKRSM